MEILSTLLMIFFTFFLKFTIGCKKCCKFLIFQNFDKSMLDIKSFSVFTSNLSLITDLFRQYPVIKIGRQDHQQSRIKETFMLNDCTTLERWRKFLKYLQSK